LLLSLIGLGTTAQAQEKYPTRPIRLLVPFPAGGPVDVMGRLIRSKTVIGRSASRSSSKIVQAPAVRWPRARPPSADADGYTLLVASAASLAIGPALYNNIGYDPATSFAPIALVSSVPYVMIAGPNVVRQNPSGSRRLRQGEPGRLNSRRSERRAAAYDRGVVPVGDGH
jgi:hypothetical protein